MYLFTYVCNYDFACLGELYGNECDKAAQRQRLPSRIVAVVIVRRVTLVMTDVSNYSIQEGLVATVCEHERQRTGHMMNQVMTTF
jgi:hypothetical protein